MLFYNHVQYCILSDCNISYYRNTTTMKFLAAFLLAALSPLAVEGEESTNAVKCLTHHPFFYTAITDFCGKSDVREPGWSFLNRRSMALANTLFLACCSLPLR